MIQRYKVSISWDTEQDLRELLRSIASDRGTVAAVAYVERLRNFCFGLQTFPLRGHLASGVDDLRVIGFERQVSVYFRVSAERVIIEHLLYAGRQSRHRPAPYSQSSR